MIKENTKKKISKNQSIFYTSISTIFKLLSSIEFLIKLASRKMIVENRIFLEEVNESFYFQ